MYIINGKYELVDNPDAYAKFVGKVLKKDSDKEKVGHEKVYS